MKWIAVSTRLRPPVLGAIRYESPKPRECSQPTRRIVTSNVLPALYATNGSKDRFGLIIVCSATAMSNGLHARHHEISIGITAADRLDTPPARLPQWGRDSAEPPYGPSIPIFTPLPSTAMQRNRPSNGKTASFGVNATNSGTMGFSKISRRFSGLSKERGKLCRLFRL